MGVDAQMFARVPAGSHLSEVEVRRLAADLHEAFGSDGVFVLPDWDTEHNWGSSVRHCLTLIDKYEQDGDDILPERGEQFIEVHPWTRYYGNGYERGNWPLIDNLCTFLLARLPEDSAIWYGGDSSGVLAEPMTPTFRRKMWAHFVANLHAPYQRAFGDRDTVHHCTFCAERPMYRSGWGDHNRYALYTCSGCGLYKVTRDGGQTWQFLTERQHENYQKQPPASPDAARASED